MTPRGDIPGEIHLAGQNTIAIHRREWSRSELIERIASRFFIIGDESISRYSWIVEARSGYSNGDAISGLNEELVELGLIGTISSMDPPPTLTIRTDPTVRNTPCVAIDRFGYSQQSWPYSQEAHGLGMSAPLEIRMSIRYYTTSCRSSSRWHSPASVSEG